MTEFVDVVMHDRGIRGQVIIAIGTPDDLEKLERLVSGAAPRVAC